MTIARWLLAGAVSLAALQSAPALALADWTFVSINGLDSNGCAITAPCRTFQGAYNKTMPGGTIVVLTPGSFGAVNISHGISIVNDGVGTTAIFAPLSPPQTAAIVITAGANDIINLRGLTIDGDGASHENFDGIDFASGAALSIENCIIKNVKQFGLAVGVLAAGSVAVSHTYISGGAGGYAVLLENRSASTALKGAFDHVQIDSGGFLVESAGPTDVVMTDSASVNNTGGFQVQADSSAPVNLTLVRATAANDTLGLFASGASATLRVSQSTITGNQHGWTVQSGGNILSYGDNVIDANAFGNAAPPGISKK